MFFKKNTTKPMSRQSRTFRPALEILEERLNPDAMVWEGTPNFHSWDDAANWYDSSTRMANDPTFRETVQGISSELSWDEADQASP